jgi:molybdenum cofactor biosynthesis enzyme MoaA
VDLISEQTVVEARVSQSLEMMAREGVGADEDTLIVALTYRCNSACTFCIIATEIGQRLQDTPHSVLDEVFAFNAEHKRFRRLTFSGAEVTLRPDLARLARRATTEGGFEVVRIQTNARRLRDPVLVKELMDAGVREFFVSLHAPTAEVDAAITQSSRSFDEAVAGVRQLVEAGAVVLTNTVISAKNVDVLEQTVRLIASLGVNHVQLWSFLEVADPTQKDDHVPLSRSMPQVRRALDTAEELGLTAVVKWLPRCLLGRHGDALDNHQPHMVIRDEFQNRLGENFGFGCVNQSCRWLGKGCDGLHETYRARFGDEKELLCPE